MVKEGSQVSPHDDGSFAVTCLDYLFFLSLSTFKSDLCLNFLLQPMVWGRVKNS